MPPLESVHQRDPNFLQVVEFGRASLDGKLPN